MVNPKLKKYVEEVIYPEYKKNDSGHDINHINYVTRRSFKFAEMVEDEEINSDMVYVIAAYHDIGHHINSEKHEKVSAKIFYDDKFMKNHFKDEKIRIIIKEAIEDHRASSKTEPRSIYGKIVSSADRMTSLEEIFKRTLSYRIKIAHKSNIYEIMDESKEHVRNKFGKEGYAAENMYFPDSEFEELAVVVESITADPTKFKNRYIEVNNIGDNEDYIQYIFSEVKKNPELSLDQKFFYTYNKLITNKTFEEVKDLIKTKNNINEMEYYLKDVDPKLIKYFEENIFPQYEKNDKGHGMVHINEVMRRAMALNETKKLDLDPNLIYAAVGYHDLKKYVNADIHEELSARAFNKDSFLKKYFTREEDRIIIKEAIEDHRSSKDDNPRSDYGKLLSSADRNTSIEMVFIRSFLRGQEETPDITMKQYLEFTFNRLAERYSIEDPENMFLEDEIYSVFLEDMRKLLENEEKFNEMYCKINNADSRNQKLKDIKPFEKQKTSEKEKTIDKSNENNKTKEKGKLFGFGRENK